MSGKHIMAVIRVRSRGRQEKAEGEEGLGRPTGLGH